MMRLLAGSFGTVRLLTGCFGTVRLLAGYIGMVGLLAGCFGTRDRVSEPGPSPDRERIARELVALEQRALQGTLGEDPELWAGRRGGNPVRVRRLPAVDPEDARMLVLLADPGELRLYDSNWELRASLGVLAGSSSWAFAGESNLFVASTLTARVTRVRIGADTLWATGEVDFRRPRDAEKSAQYAEESVAEVLGVRDLAFDPKSQTLFAIDSVRDRLLSLGIDVANDSRMLRFGVQPGTSTPTGTGPLCVAISGRSLIVASLLAHTLEVRSLESTPPPIVAIARHDGPIWSIAAATTPSQDTLWIAAGGIEDHPLDRTAEEFGFVDSFLFLYRLVGERLEPVDSFNLSAVDVVTPKWMSFEGEGESRLLWVSGYGGEHIACFVVSAQGLSLVDTLPAPPGIAHFDLVRCNEADSTDEQSRVRATDPVPSRATGKLLGHAADLAPGTIVAVSSLLDGIACIATTSNPRDPRDRHDQSVPRRGNGGQPQSDPGLAGDVEMAPDPGEHPNYELMLRFDEPTRPFSDRLGEILVYTDLLAPENQTTGPLSRFSCEACHFEGAVDGRIHFTGRDDIHATTKPLFGLSSNVPLFSRATTPDLASMVPAEFGVANQHRQDWQTIARRDHSWLRWIGAPTKIDPGTQRRALLAFLARWERPTRPERFQLEALTPIERRGLTVFRDRCAGCHRPLRTTRDEESSVPFSTWERALTSERDEIVWAAPFRTKTGVEPYPAAEGTRVPSLRGILWKRPYFTNGSAQDLESVLQAFRFRGAQSWHARGPVQADSLDAGEIEALRRVLERF